MTAARKRVLTEHFKRLDRLVHFVPAPSVDLQLIDGIAKASMYEVFAIDASAMTSTDEVMNVFERAMTFPYYFGRNWDALLDLLEDLSWSAGSQYFIVVLNCEGLRSLPTQARRNLISVLESAAVYWRDDRGEFGERTAPVACHIIFAGESECKRLISDALSEQALCDHESIAAKGEL